MRIVKGFWENCKENLRKFSVTFLNIIISGKILGILNANFGLILGNVCEIFKIL